MLPVEAIDRKLVEKRTPVTSSHPNNSAQNLTTSSTHSRLEILPIRGIGNPASLAIEITATTVTKQIEIIAIMGVNLFIKMMFLIEDREYCVYPDTCSLSNLPCGLG